MRTIALATLLVAAPALGAPSPAERAIARQHYEKAITHFNLGEFSQAAAEFREVYKVAPQPVLLYDAAQAYRLANEHAQALVLYQSYLHLVPNSPHKAEVNRRIAELSVTGPSTEETTKPPVEPEPAHPVETRTHKPDIPPPEPKPATAPSEPDKKPADKPADAVAAAGGSARLKPVVDLIRANRAGFRACFDKWSSAHPGVNGAVNLSFYLAPDGSLDRADADAKGFQAPDVESCIEDFARTLKYPPSSVGKYTRFNYPFDFKAK